MIQYNIDDDNAHRLFSHLGDIVRLTNVKIELAPTDFSPEVTQGRREVGGTSNVSALSG